MIKNYITIALRTFSKQKGFALINICGLAIGLASSIFIFLYVIDELSYDSIHPFSQDTYRMGYHLKTEDGDEYDSPGVPGVWPKEMKNQIPEVLEFARTLWVGYPVSIENSEKEKIILTEELFWTDKTFPKVLHFPILRGNSEFVFEHPNSVVINKTEAQKLFGDENPIGKMINLKHPRITDGQPLSVKITGIMDDYPSNSHIKPKYLVNLESLRPILGEDYDNYFETNWNDGYLEAYFVLKEGTPINQVKATFNQILQSNLNEESANVSLIFRKLTDIHFDNEIMWSLEGSGDFDYVLIFGTIALLILIIACINYMNLATARSAKRAKEVGLRKAFGSTKNQLMLQFFNESLITTIFALILSLFLVLVFMPHFNEMAEKSFSFTSLFNPLIIYSLIGIILFVAIVSGSYPAIYLSSFKPVEVLKSKFVAGKPAEMFRKGLVIVQFSITLILIICTGLIMKQMSFIQNSKLNENGEQIVSIRYGGTAPAEKYESLKNQLLQDASLEHVTIGNHLPRQNYFGGIHSNFQFPEIKEEEVHWSQLSVDFDFPKTYNLEFVNGRDFSKDIETDSNAFILNEVAVKHLGISTEEILNTTVKTKKGQLTGSVIGVVKDFPYRSIHQNIGPLVISARPHPMDKIVYVKLPKGKFQEKLEFIEATWKNVLPGIGFDHWFLSEEFGKMYQTERRMANLSKNFAILAISIGCLGLFGLASYLAERRTKEIGIRKVMGATVFQMLLLLFSTFSFLIFISALIAIPSSYFLMSNWMQNFAYNVGLDWLIFGLAILFVFILTIVTVGYESLKASLANPVDAIRQD
ncbi:ABC transporter permease [Flexithrix dorotheae]|uniref:ABC transporter permease n=1 Tax=Flexithrix dorotheae TaxID=70993 RepID=UPI00037AE8BA|nr:FtsX-like permease family protein [Flexithrix dorotheae]